jgi:hypothetical protein
VCNDDLNFRKALFLHQEWEEDIPKMLDFFQNCKRANEYFYWDAQTDTDTGRIKDIFWSHASQRAECWDFGDVITFDTAYEKQEQNATGNVCWVESSIAERSVWASTPSG